MVVKAPAQIYTPEDLLTMPDGDRYELVDGQLVERDMGLESSFVGGRVYGKLLQHGDSTVSGRAFPADASYQCFPDDPAKVRRPDASFVKFGRLPGERVPTGHCRIAPDVVAEVISPNDIAYDVEVKTQEWLDAGVALVWVVNPHTRTIRVCRADGSETKLRESDDLNGEGVLPGFRCRVVSLFEGVGPPSPAAAEH